MMEEFNEITLNNPNILNKIEKEDNSKPLISIIVPIYNSEKYLFKTISSIINQTLLNIEIICIDDCSTDNSLNIIKNFAKIDNRIKIFCNKKNMGSGFSRNIGLKEAKGNYIAFLDPDDYYLDNNILSDLYNFAINNKLELVGGNIEIIENENNLLDYEEKLRLINRKKRMQDSIINFDKTQVVPSNFYYNCFNFWRFIYKKNFLDANNIAFPNYKRFQDPPFLANVLSNLQNIGLVNKKFYGYRMGHAIIKNDFKKYRDSIMGVKECLDIFDKRNKYIQYTLMFKEFLERASWLETQNFNIIQKTILLKDIKDISKNIKYNKINFDMLKEKDIIFFKKVNNIIKYDNEFTK